MNCWMPCPRAHSGVQYSQRTMVCPLQISWRLRYICAKSMHMPRQSWPQVAKACLLHLDLSRAVRTTLAQLTLQLASRLQFPGVTGNLMLRRYNATLVLTDATLSTPSLLQLTAVLMILMMASYLLVGALSTQRLVPLLGDCSSIGITIHCSRMLLPLIMLMSPG